MRHNNNRIKELREARQMTVEELAERTELTTNRINKIENSKPERIMIHEATRIADVLEATLKELVENERTVLHRVRGTPDSD